MVIVLANSTYTVSELPGGSKLLTLGKQCFEWSRLSDGSAQLKRIRPTRASQRPQHKGNYWLLDVIHKPHFTSGVHLSLVVSPGIWEAYILDPGIPEKIGQTCRVVPTDEQIACPPSRLKQPAGTTSLPHHSIL